MSSCDFRLLSHTVPLFSTKVAILSSKKPSIPPFNAVALFMDDPFTIHPFFSVLLRSRLQRGIPTLIQDIFASRSQLSNSYFSVAVVAIESVVFAVVVDEAIGDVTYY